MKSIYVARQPIFELGRGLFGYELLYRRGPTIDVADGDAAVMTAEVITHALLGIGLRSLAGAGQAFVNFSRDMLLNRSWELFDRDTVVIELLEEVQCDAEVLAACKDLVSAGYKLALDDYVYAPDSAPLLDIASIAKVDMLNRSAADIEEVTRQLRPFGVRLLAEKVETETVRDVCSGLGYELFQGYLFSRPETLSKTDVAPGQLAIMRLLNLLHDPRTTDRALESAFQSDLALCYKLLRIVNAASVGGKGISSIPHAVRLVGRTTLHRWLSVLLVASLGAKGDVSHEVALAAMTRARLCELITASARRSADSGSAFIVGLLSLLDVLLEVPMDKILDRLELDDDVRGALIAHSGPLAQPLELAEAFERANWSVAHDIAARNNVSDDALSDMYIDALRWARERIDG